MKVPRVGSLFLIIFIPFLSFLISGCSVFSPVGNYFGQQYVNTVSYFNTFYNAKKLYDEAVLELEEAERRHRQQRRGGQFEISQATRQKFNDIIEKCSRLLHQYPTSRYADDAVLMIGQSYYHMRQNVQAERKFLELLAEFPDSRNIPDAQLLLAKSQLRMNKHGEAQRALENLIERLGDSRSDRDIVAQARIELGIIEKRNGNYENAVAEFLHAIENARDREIRTEARFHLANVHYELEEYEKAFSEYNEVINDRPTSRILFESQRARARILAMDDEYEKAIDLLEDLLTDLRLSDYISRIEIEAAHIYRDKGAYDKAIDQYVYVDTTHARTVVSAEAQYSLANIYKNTFGDYVKAKPYYEQVSRVTPQTEMTQSARTINEHLTRYKNYKNQITRLDSVIIAQRAELRRIEEKIELQIESKSNTSDYVMSDTLEMTETGVAESDIAEDESISIEELNSQIVSNTGDLIRNYSELAGLFYMELERPDSAIYYYSRLVYNFPESPQAPLALYALGELIRVADEQGYTIDYLDYLFDVRISSGELHEQRQTIYALLIDRYPDSEYALEAKRLLGMEIPRTEEDPMEELYHQAEEELADGNYEYALNIFEYIVEENTGSKYTPKACYAIGWLYENIFLKPDSAIVYYKTIMNKHSESQFAAAVTEKIDAWNLHLAEKERERAEEEATAEESESVEEEPEITEDVIDEEPPVQRGIPIARPTDRENFEEQQDTTRKNELNED